MEESPTYIIANCKGFLYSSTRKTKFKWSSICQPKESGGLGIIDLSLVNSAYIMKGIWIIVEDKKSLCVKWVRTVILKERSIWEVTSKQTDFWM